MSRTLSKILVLCALIVVCPLMIVGTAFAAFYSVDATVVVDVYAGEETYTDAFAHVQYKDKADSKLTITESHLKEITLKTLSTGYDFVGWYEGTVEEYTADSNVEFVSTDERLKVKMTDYANLVAVYDIKTYNVTWNYFANPTAQTSTNIKPADAKDVYYWGDALPVLEYEHYTFNGWTVEGSTELINTMKLETSGDVKLNALAASWSEDEQVIINYYNVKGEAINGTAKTIYKGQSFNVLDVDMAGTLDAGYAYSWKHGNETIDGEVTIDKDYEGTTYDVYLTATPIAYSVNVTSTDATYKNSDTVKFTVENTTALNALFNEENWTLAYSFYEFDNISFNNTEYTESTIADLVNAIVATSPYETTTAEVVGNINKYYTTITAGTVKYRTDVTTNTYGIEYVYEYEGIAILDHAGSADSSKTLDYLVSFINKDLYNDDEIEVEVDSVSIKVNGTSYAINGITADMSLNKLIEKIVERVGADRLAKGSTLAIDEITVMFLPVA